MPSSCEGYLLRSSLPQSSPAYTLFRLHEDRGWDTHGNTWPRSPSHRAKLPSSTAYFHSYVILLLGCQSPWRVLTYSKGPKGLSHVHTNTHVSTHTDMCMHIHTRCPAQESVGWTLLLHYTWSFPPLLISKVVNHLIIHE